MVVGEFTQDADLLIIGGGPGGYVAAAHAADLGIRTLVVEAAEVPGGVCLREGCIPSKALLHVARIIDEAKHADSLGVTYAAPTIDLEKVRSWKNGVIRRLATGISALLKGRQVDVITARATFENSRMVRLEGAEVARIRFKHCIIATGSRAKMLPPAVLPPELCWDAAGALALSEVPPTLLVVGGGYIGLELGQVYAALGSRVTVVEALDSLAPGMDPELARPLVAKLSKQFEAIHVKTALKSAKKKGNAIEVEFDAAGTIERRVFDRVLVSIGRRPNSDGLGLETTKVTLNDRGFIVVDPQRRTTDPRIFAIGDVAGDPMLAHKASAEGKVAVQAIAGKSVAFEPNCIPAVIYTDPEVAWCGLSEKEALDLGMKIRVTRFPWVASGRAVSMSRTDGLTKMVFEEGSQRLLGVGIVGAHAGDLISEGVLAIEMAATAEEIAGTIHPHPATSETLMEAAEAMSGHAVHGPPTK